MRDHSNKTYIVLGMHRSGTSFVTQALQDAGAEMNGRPPYHENQDFLALNNKILTQSGANWANIPENIKVNPDTAQKIKTLIAKYGKKFWGWKDPRTSLTLPAYLPYLKDDVYLIACFRKPKRVGKSLEVRGDMSAAAGEALANKYNEKLLENIKEFLKDE